MEPTVLVVKFLSRVVLAEQQSVENTNGISKILLMGCTTIAYMRCSIAQFYLKSFLKLTKRCHGLVHCITNTSLISRHKKRRGRYSPMTKLSGAILNVRGHSHLENRHIRVQRLEIACHSSLLTSQRPYFSRNQYFLGTQCAKQAFDLSNLIRKLVHDGLQRISTPLFIIKLQIILCL